MIIESQCDSCAGCAWHWSEDNNYNPFMMQILLFLLLYTVSIFLWYTTDYEKEYYLPRHFSVLLHPRIMFVLCHSSLCWTSFMEFGRAMPQKIREQPHSYGKLDSWTPCGNVLRHDQPEKILRAWTAEDQTNFLKTILWFMRTIVSNVRLLTVQFDTIRVQGLFVVHYM